jgi:anti-anti-sigma factor
LAIEVVMSRDTVTVVIAGELDLVTRPVLAEHLSLVARSRPRLLILDMSEAHFLDCGSARLIASTRRFLPDGGRLVIRRPSRVVRRVLGLTGFDAVCEIEDELRSEHDGHTAGCTSRPDRAWPAALRRNAGR